MNDITQEEVDEARRITGLGASVEDAAIIAVVNGTLLHRRIKLMIAWRRLVRALNGHTEPIMFPQANGMLHGNRPTNDLPVCRTVEGYTCSCWHIPLWKRIKLLWTGNVYLAVKGTTQPPLWIDTEVVWK